MKSLFVKLRARLSAFMIGRNGPDHLSLALLIGCLLLQILGSITRMALFLDLSLLLMVYLIYRMLSRNLTRRQEENRKFLAFLTAQRKAYDQWKLRMSRRREYKYFRCPKCHSLMRMKRGEGEKEIHCPKCQHTFKKKA